MVGVGLVAPLGSPPAGPLPEGPVLAVVVSVWAPDSPNRLRHPVRPTLLEGPAAVSPPPAVRVVPLAPFQAG